MGGWTPRRGRSCAFRCIRGPLPETFGRFAPSSFDPPARAIGSHNLASTLRPLANWQRRTDAQAHQGDGRHPPSAAVARQPLVSERRRLRGDGFEQAPRPQGGAGVGASRGSLLPRNGPSITGGQLRQRAEAVKSLPRAKAGVDPNLFGSPAKRVASYVLCQDARHTNPGLSRRIEAGEDRCDDRATVGAKS
jgi:hypothetical protein